MCGITGWISYDRDLAPETAVADAMTKTMLCRGPDDTGTWIEGHAAIGHCRLAIIDLAGGVQPMMAETPEGPVVLTYSGEAYNYLELRDELQRRGHQFRTASDTEVVLRGYLEWGEQLAEHLNGMYAFAIWDARTQKLVLIRDRLGIKPLYYYPTADGVLFGSEPKAILANPLATPAVDLDGLRETFLFLKTPGQAGWSGMHEVRPGSLVTLDRTGIRTHVYWSLTASPHTDDLETTIGKVRELLEDIVPRQLVSDVPRCMLLSGGLDSSALTAQASGHLKQHGQQIRSFAVDFVDQAANFEGEEGTPTLDAPFVHEVAEHVGTIHRDIVLDHNALADPAIRRACIAARDLPGGFGDRDLSIYLLFKAIREHSTIALSGESGDEIFGGYPSFHLPTAVQAPTFPWMIIFPIEPTGLLSQGFLEILDLKGYVQDRYSAAVAETPVLEGESETERRMRIICYLHLSRFLPVMLDRKDRISMAVGLEVRVPYCDHRLVQYVFNTPWSMKSFDGREKSLLRAAAMDMLPHSVNQRQKSGYPGTMDQRYVAAIQQQAQELLHANHAVLDFYDRQLVAAAIQVDPGAISRPQRSGIERLLDLATWMDLRRPTINVSTS